MSVRHPLDGFLWNLYGRVSPKSVENSSLFKLRTTPGTLHEGLLYLLTSLWLWRGNRWRQQLILACLIFSCDFALCIMKNTENSFLLITNLTHFFNVFIYFMSLHVSSITVLFIRRSNCVNTSSGMISLCKWLLGMPVRNSLLTGIHTRTYVHTRWFKYDRDWFVCKQAALRSSCATLREWSHNLYPPSCSG